MTSRTDAASPFALPDELSLLPDSGPLARVHVMENQIEAMVLHDVLGAAGIPHTIESYRDTAYDGLFQATRGWGAVITRDEDARRAKALIDQALAELLSSDEGEDGGAGPEELRED